MTAVIRPALLPTCSSGMPGCARRRLARRVCRRRRTRGTDAPPPSGRHDRVLHGGGPNPHRLTESQSRHGTGVSSVENLYTTQQLTTRLVGHPDRVLADAIIEACGNLESLIRNQPDDHPLINAGPLDGLPVTKAFVTLLEQAMPNYVVRSDAAAATAGAAIVAIRALERRIIELERR